MNPITAIVDQLSKLVNDGSISDPGSMFVIVDSLSAAAAQYSSLEKNCADLQARVAAAEAKIKSTEREVESLRHELQVARLLNDSLNNFIKTQS